MTRRQKGDTMILKQDDVAQNSALLSFLGKPLKLKVLSTRKRVSKTKALDKTSGSFSLVFSEDIIRKLGLRKRSVVSSRKRVDLSRADEFTVPTDPILRRIYDELSGIVDP
jgi:hypothetical protein